MVGLGPVIFFGVLALIFGSLYGILTGCRCRNRV